jgi:biofilm PGA synthesis N-glycosyltransferase PgaC
MTLTAEIIFWASVAVVAYTYAVYPLALACAARFWARPVRRAPFEGSVSIVLAAHNEAHRIAARRDELTSLLTAGGIDGELIVVSDGSTDGTAAAARGGADRRVRVLELTENVGKAEALTRASAIATGDVLVFADARQRWAPDALPFLLEGFADPTVGGTSGDLCLESAPGVTAGVGLYWRYEKVIRRLESRLHSTVGATGAISACRRRLFRPIPARTLLDDVYWPMQVVLQGYRVVHDKRACAFDRLPDHARDEFRRKVRTLSGNLQLVTRVPALLIPWRNPLWLQLVSHKLLRLAVPWLLIGMFVTSALLFESPVYRIALVAQILGYLLAALGMCPPRILPHGRFTSAAASFVVLNAAAWTAFWVWIRGQAAASWEKVTYAPIAPDAAPPFALAVATSALIDARFTNPIAGAFEFGFDSNGERPLGQPQDRPGRVSPVWSTKAESLPMEWPGSHPRSPSLSTMQSRAFASTSESNR